MDDDDDLLSLLKPRPRPKPRTPTPTPTPTPAPASLSTASPTSESSSSTRYPTGTESSSASSPTSEASPASATTATTAPFPEPDGLADAQAGVPNTSGEDDDLGAALARPRRARPSSPGQAPSSATDQLPSVRVGTERLLDSGAPDAHLRRVASVTEAQRWTALREHLAAAGPDLRWRALGWVLQQEIAFAERVIQDCRRPRRGGAVRPRKADAVEAATQNLERLVAKVEDALSALGPELAHLSGLVNALDRAGDALGLARTHLAAVCGEGVWMAGWAGCDVGTGIPGYDTPENIDAHRARVQDEVARFQARRGAEAQQRHQRTSYVEPAPKPAGIVAGLTEPDLFAATTIQASAVVDPDDEE